MIKTPIVSHRELDKGFRQWLEAVEDIGGFAKHSRRVKSADAFPKEPTNAGVAYAHGDQGEMRDTGRQPLDTVDVDKASKVMVSLSMFVPQYHMSDKIPGDKILFTFLGEEDPGVIYWMGQIESGARPAILVGGENKLAVFDGNHRVTAYFILKVPEIPVILTKRAKAFLGEVAKRGLRAK